MCTHLQLLTKHLQPAHPKTFLNPAPRSDLWVACVQSISASDPTGVKAFSSLPLLADSVEFEDGVLTVSNVDQPLDCPTGFRLSWGRAETGPTSTAG